MQRISGGPRPYALAAVAVLFFLSGATALTAEVVLNKLLTYVFGASHLSTSTVLAAYMGGLSAGAYLFGRRSEKLRRPVLAYAALELGVGIFFVLLPLLFGPFQRLGVALASPLSGSPALLTTVRFALSFVLVFAPTLMMGGTLPTMIAAFRGEQAFGRSLPILYAINTLGAATGVLLASYVVIPGLGLDGALYACAGVNFAVSAAGALLSRWFTASEGVAASREVAVVAASAASGDVAAVDGTAASGDVAAAEGAGKAAALAREAAESARREAEPARRDAEAAREGAASGGVGGGPAWELSPRVAIVLAFSQGAIAFVLEVVWFHLIGTVIGVTTYAFALMLFSILLGIGLGSLLLPVVLRVTRRPPAAIFTWAMLFAALGVAVSLRGWDEFVWVVEKTPELRQAGHFWGRELVRLSFCLALLLPTTLALGMALPALAAAASRIAGEHPGAWVGRLFAANTLGTITGSLSCGFVLLGWLGSERILLLGAGLALLVGAAALVAGRRVAVAPSAVEPTAVEPRGGRSKLVSAADGLSSDGLLVASWREVGLLAAGAMIVVGLSMRGSWDAYRLTSGSHYYWEPYEKTPVSEVMWMREDAQSGFITIMKSPDGRKTMRTNGKYEGNDAPAEFQDLFALLGGLYLKQHERAVLVGLGPARTLNVMHAMPFRHIEAVEYSEAIIAAAREGFPEFSAVPFGDTARVSVHGDDGRNHIQLSQHAYDYVAIAISGAAFAGAGSIYSRDFFQAVRGRMRDDGVFMLWIQVHHVFPQDVRSVVYTLRQVFPHVHFYTDPWQTQGFLMASPSPLTVDPERVRSLDASPQIRAVLEQHRMSSALDLVERSVFTTEEEFARYLAAPEVGAAPVLLRDLNPAFEYSTPYALAEAIGMFDFQRFSDKKLPVFAPPLPDSELALLEARRWLAVGDKERADAALRRARKGQEAVSSPP
ncbi:fused MFS/spermidine synthase [Chondromyces crocatus]|uniref:fused MFS/spermidine synthase n=1 Tax=Chondromyces crocatus TaxID=52 RepID=UPI00067A8ABE|nr:fused MFS/spermidine synthase [Chondromyces crocatus]